VFPSLSYAKQHLRRVTSYSVPYRQTTQPARKGVQEKGSRKVIENRILKALAVMTVLLALAATPAFAEEVLDQSFETYDTTGIGINSWGAYQTFQPSVTGTMDKVEVLVACCNGESL
jgi:hypothetical protein